MAACAGVRAAAEGEDRIVLRGRFDCSTGSVSNKLKENGNDDKAVEGLAHGDGVAVSASCLALGAAQEAPTKKALAGLEGTWKLESATGKFMNDAIGKATMTFKGDQVVMSVGIISDIDLKAKITLDPSKKPAEITIKEPEGATLALGIYEQTGD